MKLPQCSMLRVIGLAGIGLAAGCNEGPVAPERTPEVAAAVSTAGRGDRYIVLMKEGKSASLKANALGTSAARLGGTIERAHADIGVLQLRDLSAAAAAELARQPDVEAVVKDRKVRWLPPRDQRVHGMRKLQRQSNQRGAAFFPFQWNLRRIRAPQAWDASRQGEGTTVCILDTGVDPRHLDNTGKVRSAIGASFVSTERPDRDLDGHGTAMGAIVSSNGIGVASVAPDARLCSVKVLDRTGSGTFGDVAAGIMYVGDVGRIDGLARVDVANMSLGVVLPRNDPEIQALARMMQRAVDYSTNRGVLFVATSGNDGVNLNNPNLIHLPSDLKNVMSVGATGPINQQNFDRIASYSNVGRVGVDVFAPGGELAFARNVLEDLILTACSPSNRTPGFESCSDGVSYMFVAGTSPAAAHVSGEAAVIESELPGNQTPAQLVNCILRSADPLPNPLISANGRINVFRGQECASSSSNVASR